MNKQRRLYKLLIIVLCAISTDGYGEDASRIFPNAAEYIDQFTIDQGCIEEMPVYVKEFIHDLAEDFPFHSGMTREEVKKLVAQNNTTIRKREQEHPEPSGMPIYGNKVYHLYIYIMESEIVNSLGDGYLSFWANGRHQFWIDMAIEHNTVKNIYLLPGNFSWMLPPLRFDGTGEHIGRWTEPLPE